MAKKDMSTASSEMFKLLEQFDEIERQRLVKGVLTLFGDDVSQLGGPGTVGAGAGVAAATPAAAVAINAGGGGKLAANAGDFFALKSPQGKSEELATAARWHESKTKESDITKEIIKSVFDEARRNFDGAHYARDMGNAKIAGFFTKGGKGVFKLSYFGQNFIDTLPNRENVKDLRRPGARKKAKKKKKAAS